MESEACIRKKERIIIESKPNRAIIGGIPASLSIGVNPWPDSLESRRMEELLNANETAAIQWHRENWIGPASLGITPVRYYLKHDMGYHVQFHQIDNRPPTSPRTPAFDAGFFALLPDGGFVTWCYYVLRTERDGPVRALHMKSRTPLYQPPNDGGFWFNLNIWDLDSNLSGRTRAVMFDKIDDQGSLYADTTSTVHLYLPGKFDHNVSDAELLSSSKPVDYHHIKIARILSNTIVNP